MSDTPQPKIGKRYRILALASEWFSYHGGVSTFNRSLCTALADEGHEVSCLVPIASADEVEDACICRVSLLQAESIPGLSIEARLCLPIRDIIDPQIVIGHGHITGPAAAAQVACNYQSARRIHFLHTLPEELEWYKIREDADAAQRADRKQEVEAQLAIAAALAVAVGPRLTRLWSTHVSALSNSVMIHRFNPGLPSDTHIDHPQPAIECLITGRIEDLNIKGADIAAAALGVIAKDDQFRGATEPTLVVRGATPSTSEQVRTVLVDHAKTGILIKIKEFTHDSEKVREDIARASVVLLPSRVEGFGLVGLEALALGVPVLISKRSGLGELLLERIEADPNLAFASKYVVDVQDDLETDAQNWAIAISRVIKDRQAAFDETANIRTVLQKSEYWPRAISELFDALEEPKPIQADNGIDKSQLAAEFAQHNPAVSVALSTNLLEQTIELVAVSNRIAKAGLRPDQYVALLNLKGFLNTPDLELVKELYHRRNLAVHRAELGIDSGMAEDHARSVNHLISKLQPIVDAAIDNTPNSGKRLRRFVSVMGWDFEDYQIDAMKLELEELIHRLQQVPRPTRQLLVSIVQRSIMAGKLSRCATVPLAEISAVCGLNSEDLADQLRILERYEIAHHDPMATDYNGEICLCTLNGPWDFWNELKSFCKTTGNSIEDFIVDLRFDLLD